MQFTLTFIRSLFRHKLTPLVLVLLATALTTPGTYWIINTAYERHVLANAEMLARRVELRVELASELMSSQDQATETLRTEVETDPSVNKALFYDLRQPVAHRFGWTRGPDRALPQWSVEQLRQRSSGRVTRQEDDGTVKYIVPWKRNGAPLGFTYLEFSRSSLQRAFWDQQGELLWRVIALTGSAICFLAALGIVAYRALQNAGAIQQRAELARMGLLAERGLTAAVLAHEIRNPLAALRFQVHSLRKNAADTSRVSQTADTIDAVLLRIQLLVTEYLEYERGRAMPVQRVDLGDAVRRLQSLMNELFRHAKTELTVALPPEPVVVQCEEHALRQVLMNLLLNAQQALERDLPTPRAAITLRMGSDDTFGTIDVGDNGPGIPDEIRQHLFKPFQTTRADGHGIGLALVKRFVDNFGGSISVDSAPGKGTTFHIRLPLAQATEPQSNPVNLPSH